MKKVIIVLLALSLAVTAFAGMNMPFNHNATMIPVNASLASAAFYDSFRLLTLEFTQGFKGTNAHAKLALGTAALGAEVLLSHNLFQWEKIDMGFSYGGQFSFVKNGGWYLSPVVMWNMSHKFNNTVDFYGGTKFMLDMGFDYRWNGSQWGYSKFALRADWALYMGTQIDIADNLELFFELTPGIINSGSSGFIGVNYYIPKGVKIPEGAKKVNK
ncbi:MAG: hypothetical protein WCT23_09445 [Candidatus Neomarinimicrobiota bacterium]